MITITVEQVLACRSFRKALRRACRSNGYLFRSELPDDADLANRSLLRSVRGKIQDGQSITFFEMATGLSVVFHQRGDEIRWEWSEAPVVSIGDLPENVTLDQFNEDELSALITTGLAAKRYQCLSDRWAEFLAQVDDYVRGLRFQRSISELISQ